MNDKESMFMKQLKLFKNYISVVREPPPPFLTLSSVIPAILYQCKTITARPLISVKCVRGKQEEHILRFPAFYLSHPHPN